MPIPGSRPADDAPDVVRAPADALKHSFVQGLLWTGGMKWATQLISWPIMLVIARILTPADFGFVALVTVWTRLIMLLTEGGLGAAVVLGPPIGRDQLRQLNAVAMLLSVGAFGFASLLALPIAAFYDDADLRWVMTGVAGTFVLEGAMLIPVARLRRSMRFRELAMADGARAIVDALVTVTLAILGARYWSLVGGYAAGVGTAAAFAVYQAPTGLQWPRLAIIGETATRARQILTSSVASFLYGSADVVIGGRLLGAAAVGAYSFAGTIASAPRDKLVATLARVTPSIFGAIGSDPARTRSYVESLTQVLAITIFPIMGGIAATAPTLVPLVLGPQWDASVVPLQFLCISAAFMGVNVLVPQVLLAAGNARSVARNSILSLSVYVPLFYLFARAWGVAGLAAAWALANPVLNAWLVVLMCRTIHLPLGRYARLVVPPLVATIAMAIAVTFASALEWTGDSNRAAHLALQVLVGVAVYLAALLVLDRGATATVVGYLRAVRDGLPVASAARLHLTTSSRRGDSD